MTEDSPSLDPPRRVGSLQLARERRSLVQSTNRLTPLPQRWTFDVFQRSRNIVGSFGGSPAKHRRDRFSQNFLSNLVPNLTSNNPCKLPTCSIPPMSHSLTHERNSSPATTGWESLRLSNTLGWISPISPTVFPSASSISAPRPSRK